MLPDFRQSFLYFFHVVEEKCFLNVFVISITYLCRLQSNKFKAKIILWPIRFRFLLRKRKTDYRKRRISNFEFQILRMSVLKERENVWALSQRAKDGWLVSSPIQTLSTVNLRVVINLLSHILSTFHLDVRFICRLKQCQLFIWVSW